MGQSASIQVWHIAGDKPLPDLTMNPPPHPTPETYVRHKAYFDIKWIRLGGHYSHLPYKMK